MEPAGPVSGSVVPDNFSLDFHIPVFSQLILYFTAVIHEGKSLPLLFRISSRHQGFRIHIIPHSHEKTFTSG
jgi:hypothetical protein